MWWSRKFFKGVGVGEASSKTIFFKGSMKLNWNFQVGGSEWVRFKPKKKPWEDIFCINIIKATINFYLLSLHRLLYEGFGAAWVCSWVWSLIVSCSLQNPFCKCSSWVFYLAHRLVAFYFHVGLWISFSLQQGWVSHFCVPLSHV